MRNLGTILHGFRNIVAAGVNHLQSRRFVDAADGSMPFGARCAIAALDFGVCQRDLEIGEAERMAAIGLRL